MELSSVAVEVYSGNQRMDDIDVPTEPVEAAMALRVVVPRQGWQSTPLEAQTAHPTQVRWTLVQQEQAK